MNCFTDMSQSQLWKHLLEAQRLLHRRIEIILSRRQMMSGSVYVLRRKCGKAGCRCARGELHETRVHQYREKDGSRKTRMVPKGMRMRLASVRSWIRCGKEKREGCQRKMRLNCRSKPKPLTGLSTARGL